MPDYCGVALPVPPERTFTYAVRVGPSPQRCSRVAALSQWWALADQARLNLAGVVQWLKWASSWAHGQTQIKISNLCLAVR